jgi:hypothetical protein
MKEWNPSSQYSVGNHVYKTELTIGSYYDLSIKKLVTYQKILLFCFM